MRLFSRLPSGTFMVLYLCAFTSMLGMGIIAPILPVYAREMGASGIWIGAIFSGFSLSRFIFLPLMGRLSDRKGRKRFIVMGLGLYAVMSLAYIAARSVVELFAVRVVHGASSAMLLPVILAYVGDITPRGREGLYINAMGSSTLMGMSFGPLLGGVFTHAYGLAAAFYGLCGVSSLGLVLAVWRIPPRSAPLAGGQPRQPRLSFWHMLGDNRIRAVCAYRVSRALWRRGIMAFLPLYAVPFLHMSLAGVGTLLFICLFVGGLVEGSLGWLADRVRKMPLILLGSFGAPLLMTCIPLMEDPEVLGALLVVIEVLSALSRSAVQALGAQLGRIYGMGSVMGVYTSFMETGGVIGPMVFGMVMDLMGIRAVYYVGGLLGVLGAVWMMYHFIQAKGQALPAPEVQQ